MILLTIVVVFGGKRMKQFNPCKVTERRKKLQKTQSDVAKEAGLSLASISYIETGKKTPKANTLIRLADALKCSVDYFFHG